MNDDEQDPPLGLEDRHEELGTDVHRQGWAVPFRVREPARVLAGDIPREVLPQAGLQRVERPPEAGLLRGREPGLPARQPPPELDPFAPSARPARPPPQLPQPPPPDPAPAL